MKEPAIALLPTTFGEFLVYAFSDDVIAVIKGEIKNSNAPLVRVHSECLTGEVFGSRRCDCREQLEKSLKLISSSEKGLLIYLRAHEGRGIGLLNKIKAYKLQDGGLDTVEANHQLGFGSDMRTYEEVKKVLDYFNIHSIRLLTNNPEKIEKIEEKGIKIIERIPLKTEPTEHNEKYLKTKKEKMGHFL